MRLAEHVLAAYGTAAFLDAFSNECTAPLLTLGLLDTALGLSQRAMGVVKKGSEEEAAVSGNLGLIYRRKGDLKKARGYWVKARDLYKRMGITHMQEKMQGWIDSIDN